MAGLDTNVLVRFIVDDDARQSAAARRLIRAAVQNNQPLYVPITVTLELEWVLRSAFEFSKETVTEALARLLGTTELSFESETAVESALALYQAGSADFSDCVHVALAHQAGEQPLWTFDRSAAKLRGAKLLDP